MLSMALLLSGTGPLGNTEWNERRSAGRGPEELEAGARSGGGHERAGLPARPDGEQDAEDDRAEGEGQGQEEHGQDHERDREPADHRHSPFPFNISPAAPAVNKMGSNLPFIRK
jgi:hypothetical protein